MPTVKKRINVTVDDNLYYLLDKYRSEAFLARKPWHTVSMSFVCRHILLAYLREWNSRRV